MHPFPNLAILSYLPLPSLPCPSPSTNLSVSFLSCKNLVSCDGKGKSYKVKIEENKGEQGRKDRCIGKRNNDRIKNNKGE